ncbi:Putative type II secretion system protein F [Pirellula sp. SH-Sr6A]|uniref:type II secretion system F family protein n=1 Tax=Pirellula sp. SH-Sr6A TaxID=1632865 RepID=UPI00078BEC41|nr:type II secretion system F family protein [Pirellula sp. SH-Sr6A]AMV31149.1 Putative type II secretion system protein F [Pirellula sp. SH-Sr6A]
MPMYQFEAMDRTGQEIRDVIEAPSEEEAQNTIRQMGYFVTKLSLKKGTAAAAGTKAKKKRGFSIGGAKTKHICTFTRQLSILQDAGLPILRSLKILENNQKPGKLKYTLQDVCEEIETGLTLSEAMAKAPKVFSRLYVNMIKAGEAGGALETILQRLAEFLESAESLKRKVKGALIYPIAVVLVAIAILAGIMFFIVPTFKKMFDEFELKLPPPTLLLMAMSDYVVNYFWLMFLLPICCWLIGKIIRKFKHGRMGFDQFIIKVPVFGSLIERNILARTTRTLGTLITSGVPILEALNITRETAGNAMFERIFNKVIDAIREGDVIAKPMKEHSSPGFHPMALFYWCWMGAFPGIMMMSVALTAGKGVKQGGKAGSKAAAASAGDQLVVISGITIGAGVVGMALWYLLRMKTRVIDDLVVNMIDVGEETGELDTMLYKIADNYDEEVRVMTEGLTKLIEPMLIVFLGVAVGFIVISLFMPLISLITSLS